MPPSGHRCQRWGDASWPPNKVSGGGPCPPPGRAAGVLGWRRKALGGGDLRAAPPGRTSGESDCHRPERRSGLLRGCPPSGARCLPPPPGPFSSRSGRCAERPGSRVDRAQRKKEHEQTREATSGGFYSRRGYTRTGTNIQRGFDDEHGAARTGRRAGGPSGRSESRLRRCRGGRRPGRCPASSPAGAAPAGGGAAGRRRGGTCWRAGRGRAS